jgi:hypothetical protein
MYEARKAGIETGLEVPAIEGIDDLIQFSGKHDYFINLNELEFSDTNAEALKKRKYTLVNDISNAVEGSTTIAKKAIRKQIRGHFCSSRYKDTVQLRKRLIRTAENVRRPLDMVTDDGTIIFGIIHTDNTGKIRRILQDNEVPIEYYDVKTRSIEIAAWVLEKIAGDIRDCERMEIVEKYPIKNGIIVESMPV